MTDARLRQIYRYAGEMAYISASYLNDVAESEGKPRVVDMQMSSLTLPQVKWLLREYGRAELKTKIPRLYRNLTTRFTTQKDFQSVGFKDLDSVGDWDSDMALAYFNKTKREREARRMLVDGLRSADLKLGESGLEHLGINRSQYEKWRAGMCYCPSEIIDAIYDAGPVGVGYLDRLSAILSGLPTSKWIMRN